MGDNCADACPAGYKAIADTATCVAAAQALHPYNETGCWGNPWADVVREESSSTMPFGCYKFDACQGGCGLNVNSFVNGNTSQCGNCYGTSLLCVLDEIAAMPSPLVLV